MEVICHTGTAKAHRWLPSILIDLTTTAQMAMSMESFAYHRVLPAPLRDRMPVRLFRSATPSPKLWGPSAQHSAVYRCCRSRIAFAWPLNLEEAAPAGGADHASAGATKAWGAQFGANTMAAAARAR